MSTTRHEGFTLLIAIIFVSVLLALALTLGSLGYKQEVIARTASDSQYAYYAADAALECALVEAYGEDSAGNPFAYTSHNSGLTFPCGGKAQPLFGGSDISYTATQRQTQWRLDIQFANPVSHSGSTHFCADVTVYAPQDVSQATTVFSQGYSIPCSQVGVGGVNFSARGLYATVYQR